MTRKAKRVLTYEEEYAIAVNYVCGVPVKEICETFDITRMTVNRVLDRLDVQRDRRGKR